MPSPFAALSQAEERFTVAAERYARFLGKIRETRLSQPCDNEGERAQAPRSPSPHGAQLCDVPCLASRVDRTLLPRRLRQIGVAPGQPGLILPVRNSQPEAQGLRISGWFSGDGEPLLVCRAFLVVTKLNEAPIA